MQIIGKSVFVLLFWSNQIRGIQVQQYDKSDWTVSINVHQSEPEPNQSELKQASTL